MVTATMRGVSKARKSTTGMALMRDAHCFKVPGHTQSTISLTGGESEYYGFVKCAVIGSGARSMLADFGMCADTVVRIDSSSGLVVGSRRGLSRLRQLQTLHLWAAAANTGRRPSLEEGAGRHERERRADETSGREAQ